MTIPSGKYANYDEYRVMNEDPSYVKWCYTNQHLAKNIFDCFSPIVSQIDALPYKVECCNCSDMSEFPVFVDGEWLQFFCRKCAALANSQNPGNYQAFLGYNMVLQTNNRLVERHIKRCWDYNLSAKGIDWSEVLQNRRVVANRTAKIYVTNPKLRPAITPNR